VVSVFLRRYFFWKVFARRLRSRDSGIRLFAALLFLESIWAAAAKWYRSFCGPTFFGKYLGGGPYFFWKVFGWWLRSRERLRSCTGLFAALLVLESIWAVAAKSYRSFCGATFFGKYLGGGYDVDSGCEVVTVFLRRLRSRDSGGVAAIL
jgi:hypothetical protein